MVYSLILLYEENNFLGRVLLGGHLSLPQQIYGCKEILLLKDFSSVRSQDKCIVYVVIMLWEILEW